MTERLLSGYRVEEQEEAERKSRANDSPGPLVDSLCD